MKQTNNTTQPPLSPQHEPAMPHVLSNVLTSGLDVKLYLIQHYAELARMLARELL